jgi:hypothetical protein
VIARPLFSRGFLGQAPRFVSGVVIVAAILATCLAVVTVSGAARSNADVGELGPAPSDVEMRQAFTDFYNAGHPPDTTVDVEFPGPILVGQPTVHPNPPPDPWCVRCGYPDQGTSPMYPVLALVSVTITQGLEASALPSTSFAHTITTTYNGTPCTGETKAEYCPSYFFYRDGAGRWRVAAS